MALIQDTVSKNDRLFSNDGEADIFFFNVDGKRDVIATFEIGHDRIDFSHYDVDFTDLKIVDKNNGTGVRIVVGDEKLHIIGAEAADFTEDMFIFRGPAAGAPPGPYIVQADTNAKNDKLDGTDGLADQFVLQNDGLRDVIRGFEDGTDVIDLTAFSGVDFDDLKIVNKAKGNHVRIVVEDEIILVRNTDASDFSADDFLFA